MKESLPMTLLVLCIAMVMLPAFAQKKLENIFYSQNTFMGFQNSPQTPEQKAKLLKSIGFDGLEGFGYNDFHELKAALDKEDLSMPVNYVRLRFETEKVADSTDMQIKEMIKSSSKGSILYFALVSESFKEDKATGDKIISNILRGLTDYALPYGVKLCVYPHIWDYCETVAHSVSLARMVKRKNFGASINLCHLLRVEGSEGIDEKVKSSSRYLFAVNICGADTGDTQSMGWDRLIRPLGEGSFDTYGFLKTLWDTGYKGPIGLQNYNLKGDAKETLTQSFRTWSVYKQRYLAKNQS